ncbi:MAG: M50 family metallopeptidase [Chitinispirillaceae bacterium]
MSGIVLTRMGGCDVRVERGIAFFSPVLILVLTYGLFPYYFPGLSIPVYWGMGVAAYAGLVVSVMIHECGHLAAARISGLEVASVTLYPFGGVALRGERGLGQECWVSLAGPAASMIFAGVFFLLHVTGKEFLWSVSGLGIFNFLVYANLSLAFLNFLPFYPLDGGSIFRAGLGRVTRSYSVAVLVSTVAGVLFALFLLFTGTAFIVRGVIAGGVWWLFLGVSVFCASEPDRSRHTLRGNLQKTSVTEVMCRNPVSVSGHISLEDFTGDCRHFCSGQRIFPVLDREGRPLGVLSSAEVMAVPSSEWGSRAVWELTRFFSEHNSVSCDTDCFEYLSSVSAGGGADSVVLDENGQLSGMISLENVIFEMKEKWS